VPAEPAPHRRIRRVAPTDIPALVDLIHDHAAYERSAPLDDDLDSRLPALLFGDAPRLHAFVADQGTRLVGFTTASFEVSTWKATEYLHMDCLYVDESARGGGIGRLLMQQLRELAASRGVSELQWQTPDWNVDAIRFYDRTGAERRQKSRYALGS